ncbi:MAG: hypothetical protein DMF78_15420, partial [Acidobacteria bacterium]
SVQVLGKTTRGEDMLMAVISSEANLKKLPRLKEIARRIADPRGLGAAEATALAEEGRLFVLVTCNIHASEIGASQMAMEWAHALATAQDAETRRRLDEVVLLLVPSLNPDGQIMETEWYRQNLGTPYEGGRLPWLYHHYVGHDNNRDWFMLTQKETQALTRAVYHEWFPQVWLDEHQMGATGPRIFTPPYSDPVAADIHPLVWREVNVIGTNMALRLEQADKSGVIYGFSYDAYWPGGTKNTAWWKNVSGLLTEVASARLATPIRIEKGELAGGRKGLVQYEQQINFPNPWPGGVWRLRDIMDYERIISDALLESCAAYRRDFLRDAITRARAAVATFGPRDGYRIPADQRDRATAHRLAALMIAHGVEVKQAPGGDVWIPLAQPYGRFVEEMFTVQRYPEVKLVAGRDIVRPYDVSAWSLPLMMGVSVERASLPSQLTGRGARGQGLDGAGTGRPLRRARARGLPRRRRGARGRGQGRAGRELESGALGTRGRGAVARATRGPLQVLVGRHRRGLDAVRARAVRLRAEEPRQQGHPRRQPLRVLRRHRARGREQGGHRQRPPAPRRGRDALLGRAADRLPRRARQGRGGGAARLREGRGNAHRALGGDGVRDRGAVAARAQRAGPRARGGVPGARFAAPRPRHSPPRDQRPARGGGGLPGQGHRVRDDAARRGDGALGAGRLPRRPPRHTDVGIRAGRGAAGAPRGGGGDDLRQGQGGAARLPPAASRADAGHLPVPVQRAVVVGDEVAARAGARRGLS